MLRDKRLIESDLLVVRWLRGDGEAFDAIVRLWERSLFYYVRRLVGSEADAWEVMQETWLKVLRAGKSLRDPGAFPAFLYRIARNVAVSRLRHDGVRLELREAVEPDAGEVAHDWVEGFDDADEVHTALDRISMAHREALTLFFLKELSLQEIAELLEIPLGTVKSRLHHARRAMRQCLEELKGDSHVGKQ